jgi:hypothetical protein
MYTPDLESPLPNIGIRSATTMSTVAVAVIASVSVKPA